MFEKKHILILGLITLGVLIFVNTSKKLTFVEVQEPSTIDKKSFDSSALPLNLMPPKRLGDNEPVPNNKVKKNFSSILNIKPRLDNRTSFFL